MQALGEKAALRKVLRSLHGGMQERAEQSVCICRHIIASPWYAQARVIGGYVPLKWEADVTAVLQHALCSGRTLALPLCGEAGRMTLRRVRSLEELIPGAYGIPEPMEDTEIIDPAEVGLLLTPLEGIEDSGLRLGKGGGYYDRLLAGCDVRSMGCALSWQWVERIPANEWDVRLRACADRDGIHYF